MENMTVYSVLALLPDTQIQINDFINQLLIPIENGSGEPIKLLVKLRKIELLVEQAKEKIIEIQFNKRKQNILNTLLS